MVLLEINSLKYTNIKNQNSRKRVEAGLQADNFKPTDFPIQLFLHIPIILFLVGINFFFLIMRFFI